MKYYYKKEGEETRRGWMGHATGMTSVSVTRREMKNGTSHHEARAAASSRTQKERKKDARVAPNAITRGASWRARSRTEPRWLHKASRVFRWTLHHTKSDFLLNWPLICFRSRTAVEVEKKHVLFSYIQSQPQTYTSHCIFLFDLYLHLPKLHFSWRETHNTF